MVEGVRAYAEEVRARRFPDAEHVYSVDPAELEELKRYLDRRASPPRPGTGRRPKRATGRRSQRGEPGRKPLLRAPNRGNQRFGAVYLS